MWSATCPERPTAPQEQLLLARAATCYARVAESLVELQTLFPFPSGGHPTGPEEARVAVKLLKAAREAESEGLHLLGELLEKITD
jgi:hypothetical protein